MDSFRLYELSQSLMTGNDFLDSFQLNVTFTSSYVEHHRFYSDRQRGLRNLHEVETWKRKKEIGRGGFGVVYLEENGHGRCRAVKEIPKVMGRETTIDPLREITAMASFSKNEAHFVKLEGWYQNQTHLYVAMEYFELGDLHHCLDQPVSETAAQEIMFQLNEAICFMHGKGFTHRDLKPANVFVVSQSPSWWVKLADLGITKRVQGDSTALYTSFDGNFMAPEILGFTTDASLDRYTKAVDCWALGCLAFWLMTLQNVVPRQNLFAFCSGNRTLSTKELSLLQASAEAINYVTSLVKADPKQRLTAREALDHPWIQKASESIAFQNVEDLMMASPAVQGSKGFSKSPITRPPFPSVEEVSDEEFEQSHEVCETTVVKSMAEREVFSNRRQKYDPAHETREPLDQQPADSLTAVEKARQEGNERIELKDDSKALAQRANPEMIAEGNPTSLQTDKGDKHAVFETPLERHFANFSGVDPTSHKTFDLKDPLNAATESGILSGEEHRGRSDKASSGPVCDRVLEQDDAKRKSQPLNRTAVSPTRPYASTESRHSPARTRHQIGDEDIRGLATTETFDSRPEVFERQSRAPKLFDFNQRMRVKTDGRWSACHEPAPLDSNDIQKLQDELWDELRKTRQSHGYRANGPSNCAQVSDWYEHERSSKSEDSFENGKREPTEDKARLSPDLRGFAQSPTPAREYRKRHDYEPPRSNRSHSLGPRQRSRVVDDWPYSNNYSGRGSDLTKSQNASQTDQVSKQEQVREPFKFSDPATVFANFMNQEQEQEQVQEQEQEQGREPFKFSDPASIFTDFLNQERNRPEDAKFLNSFGISVVEKPIVVSLEHLFYGGTKKLKVRRKVYNWITGVTNTEENVLEVVIKPGWQSAKKIKFRSVGDSTEDIEQQDIHFVLTQAEHPKFTREGNDLRTTVEIGLRDALTGWSQTVESIDGKIVTVHDAGPTPEGHVAFFPGLGMPLPARPEERGDLLVVVRVVFPRTLTFTQKGQIRSLGPLG